MAMGPGVCLEYGGMRRYKPNSNKRNISKSSNSNHTFTILLLITIIVGLVAFIIAGGNWKDFKKML